MELVWVRYGDEVRSFPVLQNKMMVNAIADFWKLDASAMCIGEQHALVKDANGNSILGMQDIRQLATQCGLGDGMSTDSAIQITDSWDGKSDSDNYNVSATSFISKFLPKRNNQEEETLTERFLKRVCRRTPAEVATYEQSRRHDAVKHSLFYAEGCIYSYLNRLNQFNGLEREQHIFDEVKSFVGTVHVLAATNEKVGAANCVGMVSLLKPDGACMTAYECVKDTTKNVFVCFQHLQESGTVTYECKVICLETWALLEPVEQKNFNACMAVGSLAGPPSTVFSFSLDKGEWKFVRATVAWSCSHLQVLLPTSSLNMVGAPVVNSHGLLCGIVTSFMNLKGRRTFQHGWLKQYTTVADLKLLVDSFKERTVYHDLCVGLKVKQLVDCTWTRAKAFVRLVDEWNLKHPISEF